MIVRRNFDSFYDFVIACRDGERVWRLQGSQTTDSKNGWSGTRTFDDAIKMALVDGWPEGRRLMADSLAVASPKPEPYKSIELSVAGAFPVVPVYCAGDPECMMIDPGASLRHAKPIVRIDYSCAVSASILPIDIMLRGAAILSLANTLEGRGFSTELRITKQVISHKHCFQVSVAYKQAGESLDIDRASFALAHPSLNRRLMLSLIEQHSELEREFSGHYGAPVHAPLNDYNIETIFVSAPQSHETPESARTAVETAAAKLLSEISDADETGAD